MTKFERVTVVLAAVALIVMSGWFVVHQGNTVQLWSVEVQKNDSIAPSASVEEEKRPDSLMGDECININTASAADLARLPGIGATRAQAIVEHRQEQGAFSDVDELLRVNGVGPGILNSLRPYVTVE